MPSTASTCYDVNPNYIVYSPILVQAMRCTQLFNDKSLSYWWAIVRIYIYGERRKKQPYYTSLRKPRGYFFEVFRGSKTAGDDGLTPSFVDLITTPVAQ
jgi:hypothetical protein